MPYFGQPVGRVKIQTTSKNSQRYYTTKRLIRDLLSRGVNRFSDRRIWPQKSHRLWIFAVNRADWRILKTLWIVDSAVIFGADSRIVPVLYSDLGS